MNRALPSYKPIEAYHSGYELAPHGLGIAAHSRRPYRNVPAWRLTVRGDRPGGSSAANTLGPVLERWRTRIALRCVPMGPFRWGRQLSSVTASPSPAPASGGDARPPGAPSRAQAGPRV